MSPSYRNTVKPAYFILVSTVAEYLVHSLYNLNNKLAISGQGYISEHFTFKMENIFSRVFAAEFEERTWSCIE